MNPACQADDARIARFRTGTALIWFGQLGGMIREFARRYPGAARGQDRPVPDLTFESRLGLRVGDLELELIAAPGGETVDSCVVVAAAAPDRAALQPVGPLFPHFRTSTRCAATSTGSRSPISRTSGACATSRRACSSPAATCRSRAPS